MQSTTGPQAPGSILLELRVGLLREHISAALVQQALYALPDEHALVHTLRRWLEQPTEMLLEPTEVLTTAEQLALVAHTQPQGLGLVGLPIDGTDGLLVGGESQQVEPVSAAVVLALALERWGLLLGPQARVVLHPQEGAGR